MSGADVENLGPESLLGIDAQGEHAQDVRDRLALATRYLANFYRAVADSADVALWRQRIDTVRAKVERAYSLASTPDNATFLGSAARAAYVDAAAGWPQLWRDLKLSPDTLIERTLLDRAASIAEAPLSFLPTFAEGLAKSLGDTLGGIARQLAPAVAVAGAVGLVYVFRRPLLALVGKLS